MVDAAVVKKVVDGAWDAEVLPALEEFVRIPNVSVVFDPEWDSHGHMAKAVELVRTWCEEHAPTGSSVEVHEIAGRTPLLLVDVPATDPDAEATDTVLLYGHLDKQPPFDGWREGLDAWTPVFDGDRLYGRGVADDGYAAFAALVALRAISEAGGTYGRCVLLIEASEESGSPDLPAHLEALGDRLGTPSLVIGLDSGCADWEHLWITTSLRGVANFFLTVEVLTEGVHSGAAGGIAPSTFRILRLLLDRIEDPVTGDIRLPALGADVPLERRKELETAAALVGSPAVELPFLDGVRPEHDDPVDLLVAKTWAPALEVVGVGGAPLPEDAGNVLRPRTIVKLSMRLPPTVDAHGAARLVIETLEADPPYGAAVRCELEAAESGWAAPPTAPWLAGAIDAAAGAAYERPAQAYGEGGTIPFMGMLGRRFPDAQFVITGVLGPGSNAHGPNEFLHIPTGKRVTEAVAHIVAAHAER